MSDFLAEFKIEKGFKVEVSIDRSIQQDGGGGVSSETGATIKGKLEALIEPNKLEYSALQNAPAIPSIAGLESQSNKNQNNGYAGLDSSGKVASAQLPSYVDDVIDSYRVGSTPLASDWLSLTVGGVALTPENGKIYIVITSGDYVNISYRWSGSAYVSLRDPMSYATQAEAEANTENTKVMTALRVFQSIVYQIKNYSFVDLLTNAKNIFGAINELYTSLSNKLSKTGETLPLLPKTPKFYNWLGDNTTKLAPTSWRVATTADWETLITYAGGASVAGGKLKEIGNLHWYIPNSFATDDFGFTAVAEGLRNYNGDFESGLRYAFFRRSTDGGLYSLGYDRQNIVGDFKAFYLNVGISVRCVRDTDPGVKILEYDGFTYDIVQIGSQWWLKQSLRNTHYNDGTAIPFITDSNDWDATTTGACCTPYNGDVSYKLMAFDSNGNIVLVNKSDVGGGRDPMSYATQAEAEANTENTKVMTALRVFQNWLSNVTSYSINSLNTTSKFIVGAINELLSSINNKVDKNTTITGATKTKITYDTNGLITSGTDATTADISDSTNKRYVTDAQATIINNTTNTNSGDNATNIQYSGLASSKQNVLVSGTNIKTVGGQSILGAGNLAISGAKLRIFLHVGAAELTGAATEPLLVGVAGTNSNWSEAQFNDTTVQNLKFIIGEAYTVNWAGGDITCKLRWKSALSTFIFTVSGITVTPTAGATYTNNGVTFTVVSANIAAGIGTITCTALSAPSASGTLTKASGTGDSSIAFSANTTGAVKWQVKVLARGEGQQVDTDYDATNAHIVTTTVNATATLENLSSIAWTPIAAELSTTKDLLVQITRVSNDGADTLVGDAQLISTSIIES